MKLFAFLIVTALAVLPFVSANHYLDGVTGSVEVHNLCTNKAIFRSVGDYDGPEITLQPGSAWSEKYYIKEEGGGPSIKIWTEGGSIQKILQFEYNPGKRIWYNLSCKSSTPLTHPHGRKLTNHGLDVNCWNAAARSGNSCPFWNQSIVVESPGENIPCPSGKDCKYIYRCPHDDDPRLSIIDGPPMHILDDASQNIKLLLCPCENDPSSPQCALAHAPGLPTTPRSHRIQSVSSCPEEPFSEKAPPQPENPQEEDPKHYLPLPQYPQNQEPDSNAAPSSEHQPELDCPPCELGDFDCAPCGLGKKSTPPSRKTTLQTRYAPR